MDEFQRAVRAAVYTAFRDTSRPPTPDAIASALGARREIVVAALGALAAEHILVLRPDGETVWMAHPFSGVPTDVVAAVGAKRWFANCVWDGLSIIGLFGDGRLETVSPATHDALQFDVADGVVSGEAIVHFLVPPRRFWDDIHYT
jgi:alkylmercury lyase-like protein